jgi:hypothetical protein
MHSDTLYFVPAVAWHACVTRVTERRWSLGVTPLAGKTGFITRVTFAPVMVLLLYVALFSRAFCDHPRTASRSPNSKACSYAVKCLAAFLLFDTSGDGRVSYDEFQVSNCFVLLYTRWHASAVRARHMSHRLQGGLLSLGVTLSAPEVSHSTLSPPLPPPPVIIFKMLHDAHTTSTRHPQPPSSRSLTRDASTD